MADKLTNADFSKLVDGMKNGEVKSITLELFDKMTNLAKENSEKQKAQKHISKCKKEAGKCKTCMKYNK